MQTSSGLKRRLALALMLSSSLTVAALGLAPPAHADAFDVFSRSGYTYCDAKLIGQLWGISTLDAKTQIGQKITSGIGGNIPGILVLSRRAGHRCGWPDTGYSYNDAVELSRVWGVNVDGAKAKIANYVTNAQGGIVNRVLGHGPSWQ
jgi:hypothetical protein